VARRSTERDNYSRIGSWYSRGNSAEEGKKERRKEGKKEKDNAEASMKAAAKSRDTGSVGEAGAGSRAARRFVPGRSSQTLDAADDSPAWEW